MWKQCINHEQMQLHSSIPRSDSTFWLGAQSITVNGNTLNPSLL